MSATQQGGPPKRGAAPSRPETADGTAESTVQAPRLTRGQAVTWWPVHEFVARHLESARPYPWPGTEAWCALADDDQRKWAGLLEFAEHHFLRIGVAQDGHREALHNMAGVVDWSELARQQHPRANSGAYIPRDTEGVRR